MCAALAEAVHPVRTMRPRITGGIDRAILIGRDLCPIAAKGIQAAYAGDLRNFPDLVNCVRLGSPARMTNHTFLYRCPNTGHKVQGVALRKPEDSGTYETVTCAACNRMHLVNPTTGHVAGVSRP